MNISSLKSNAKEAFKANYWPSVAVAFVVSFLAMGTSFASSRSVQSGGEEQELTNALNSLTPSQTMLLGGMVMGGLSLIFVVSLVLRIFVFNPLEVGGYRFFRRNVRESGVPV